MTTSIKGSCLCGGVRYEITGKPLALAHCHCSRCRKASGSAFGSDLLVRAGDFRFTAGEELVERFVPEPPFELVRCFCRRCGSYLGEPHGNDKAFPIAASTLDDDPGVRPAIHENVASKAPWYEITDDLPRYPGNYTGNVPE